MIYTDLNLLLLLREFTAIPTRLSNAFFRMILTISRYKSDTQASKGWKASAEMWNKNRYLRPSGYVLWQQERGREPKICPTQKRTMMGREL
jgi:hypothetical protein